MNSVAISLKVVHSISYLPPTNLQPGTSSPSFLCFIIFYYYYYLLSLLCFLLLIIFLLFIIIPSKAAMLPEDALSDDALLLRMNLREQNEQIDRLNASVDVLNASVGRLQD